MSLLLWLIIVPAVCAVLCLVLPGGMPKRLCLVAGGAGHLVLACAAWRMQLPMADGGMLGLDPLGRLFLTLNSVLFLAVAVYYVGYHQHQLVSPRIFLACLLLLLASLSLVCISQHLGILWVALETASLAATPLIYFRLGAKSLEATWKFLLMNSVGIALALLGILAMALGTTAVHGEFDLTVRGLVKVAGEIDPTWLRAGFLLALIGFGTKMGLAPLHSWKPDAYGEAPPPIAAILAGGMTLGAFLGILRVVQICNAAGLGEFVGMWMCIFGLVSIAVAAIFVVRNNDCRRLLAYTSVEHMGVLVLGVGLAAGGSYASMLHAMHNTLNKGVLFFIAGFLWRLFHTTRCNEIRGTVREHPVAGVLLLAGICATCGLPPFGMFYSELGILLAAMRGQHWWTAGIFVVTMTIVFVGVVTALLPMAFGEASEVPESSAKHQEGWKWRQPVMLAPAAALAVLALGLGTYQPRFVTNALQEAADTVNVGCALAHRTPTETDRDCLASRSDSSAQNERCAEAHPTREVTR